MPANTAALARAANGLASTVTQFSLHTNDPGSNGTANEISGGAYERRPVAYGTTSNGTASITGNVVFQGPAGTPTVTHLGFWAGSTFLGWSLLSAPKTIGTGDTLTITAAPITVTAT